MKNTELSEEVKIILIASIQEFFLSERAEEISNFQATIILDFMLSSIGPLIYNQAIDDAHTLLHQQVEELYSLQKHR